MKLGLFDTMVTGDKMRKYRTLLFDLDGTLIDTNSIIIESYRHTFKTHRPDVVLSDQEIIDFIGPPLEKIFVRYTSKQDAEAWIETYRRYYKAHEKNHFTLYPDVQDVLKELHRRGIKMGIVTSKYKAGALPSVDHFGLTGYFDAFVGLDDVQNAKPDAEPVLTALKQLGDSPSQEVLMIGDNQSDIQAGLNAGVDGAGVAWSIKGAAFLEKAQPTLMLHTMKDLLNLV